MKTAIAHHLPAPARRSDARESASIFTRTSDGVRRLGLAAASAPAPKPVSESRVGPSTAPGESAFHALFAPGRVDVAPVLDAAIDALSPRERDVLCGLLSGRGDKQIADDLSLSRHTVHQYSKSVYRKFCAGGRVELLAMFLGTFERS